MVLQIFASFLFHSNEQRGAAVNTIFCPPAHAPAPAHAPLTSTSTCGCTPPNASPYLTHGVDPSIRSEVCEFLLGCYALGNTADYRRQIRIARREHYNDLLKQCQRMHSSIGTGSLAFPGYEDDEDEKEFDAHEGDYSAKCKLIIEDVNMHSFQINNNADLVMESNVPHSPSKNFSHLYNSEIESVHPHAYEPVLRSDIVSQKVETVNRLRFSDVPKTPLVNETRSQEGAAHDERISEWLWTLHRIVVDVVRTDSHLQFYEDKRNVARMFDILAVYAWVDPATGYCQGMSDLLSPFVVIFEDNADAFWCFKMLIRRMVLKASFCISNAAGSISPRAILQ
ncbi:hypothetical protein F3Y22_tig00002511pilonHSYRG00486 [Hibiscus syriacus]|uniref:Rab-GAP TBC domain-containing protein n=1 Tax=Hibiscus syriacus TaxID=106335 RepID=A0A6A3CRP4_HIBSY|nr:hypothetical protein F3Y22_tig00002511pilonHSYRG00486 [Hibiscus syriacus]